jgi:hypothetical protein
VAQYLDAMGSSDEEDKEATLAGVAAAGSSSEDPHSDSDDGDNSDFDSDDDLAVGQLRAGSDSGAPSSES